jgi:hypothetical protein
MRLPMVVGYWTDLADEAFCNRQILNLNEADVGRRGNDNRARRNPGRVGRMTNNWKNGMLVAEETNMQNKISTIELGTKREFVCSWCTQLSSRPQRRQHVYGEYLSRSLVECFWECVTCGHQRPVSIWDENRENDDLRTERLHAQWRKDNGELMTSGRSAT